METVETNRVDAIRRAMTIVSIAQYQPDAVVFTVVIPNLWPEHRRRKPNARVRKKLANQWKKQNDWWDLLDCGDTPTSAAP